MFYLSKIPFTFYHFLYTFFETLYVNIFLLIGLTGINIFYNLQIKIYSYFSSYLEKAKESLKVFQINVLEHIFKNFLPFEFQKLIEM